MLETWLFLATAQLSDHIAAEGRAADARKPFRERLAPIAVILHMLLIFAQRMKAQLQDAVADMREKTSAILSASLPAQRANAPSYIDTS